MRHLMIGFGILVLWGCSKPAEPRLKPGDTIVATIHTTKEWNVGDPTTIGITFVALSPDQSSKTKLLATDMPKDFAGEIEVYFFHDSVKLDKPLKVAFTADC